jgi:hypothetical protein
MTGVFMTMTRLGFLTAIFFVMGGALCVEAAEKALSESDKIEALIKRLEVLNDATFIRNGSDYNSKQAGRFLRGKWKAQGKDIKTAAEFIDKIASVSSTSGKPYVIRFKDGRETKAGEYLKTELKKVEGNDDARNC